MTNSESVLVENLLSRPEMHRQWARDYRTDDNERFYEQAFDFIAGRLKPEPGTTFLDAGCGSCAHSVRLARRGFKVHAVDFSESALRMALQFVREKGVQDRITLGRESLLELSFPDQSFDYVLCWGVLMHIPDVKRAVAELARVLKPGGALVISEGNKSSLEAVAMRNLKRVLRREKAQVKDTPAGVEYWKEKDGDALVTRQANIRWLIQELDQHGLSLTTRAPGQFTESYRMTSAPRLKRFIHGFNNFWFQRLRFARPAFGNILFLEKRR
ncbi:MAG TPA: class I SAM-dependent methyltransferase [Pyrinomonadaceae bacterium]